MSDQTVDRWFDEQDSDEILRAMNRIPVRAGDSVLVPAGMPHAIGAGVFLIELQEPTDFSVMLEWQAFGLDDAHESQLGMGGREALGCLDASAWPADTVTARFVRRRVVQPGSTDDILATDADPYFRALHAGTTRLPACFGVLVVTAGAGSLEAHGTHTPVGVGSTVLIPFAAAPVTPHGDFYGVLCLPPERAPAG